MFSIFDAVLPDTGWSIERDMMTAGLNVKQIAMCRNTGDLPGKYCPHTEDSWFIPGVSPIRVSNIYRAIPILKDSAQRACWYDPVHSEMKVFEFWRSDFLQLFRQAGISLKTPPAYAESCGLDQKSTSGLQPIINSPQSTLEYAVRPGNDTARQVPFIATVDPDVRQLFWFIDDRFVGVTGTQKPLFWSAESGSYTVRVVDDSGRSASTGMRVFDVH
jgi:penicillin-binding protein 1C